MYSQTLNKDTLFLNESTYFTKNDIVEIGKGSQANGGYSFIYVAPQKSFGSTVPPVPLQPNWMGYKMKIVDFKKVGNEVMGERYHLVLTSAGKKPYYWCDIQNALLSGEIIKK